MEGHPARQGAVLKKEQPPLLRSMAWAAAASISRLPAVTQSSSSSRLPSRCCASAPCRAASLVVGPRSSALNAKRAMMSSSSSLRGRTASSQGARMGASRGWRKRETRLKQQQHVAPFRSSHTPQGAAVTLSQWRRLPSIYPLG